MATTPEGKVKAAVKQYLDSIGAYWVMPATGGFGRSGVPDFLVCWRGMFVGVETKAPGKIKNTHPLQAREIESIGMAGGRAVVVDSVAMLKELFAGLTLEPGSP